jgi:hypothetical protein
MPIRKIFVNPDCCDAEMEMLINANDELYIGIKNNDDDNYMGFITLDYDDFRIFKERVDELWKEMESRNNPIKK